MKLSDTIEHMLKSGMRGRDVVDFVRRWEAEQEPKRKPRRATEPDAFSACFPDVDAPRLQAFIRHRNAKRAALTPHAADLFRSAAEACALTIIEAIDMCIERNWITVKPEWLQPAPMRMGAKRESYADAYKDIIGHERSTPEADFLPPERLQGVSGHGQENQPGDLLRGCEDVPSYRH